MGSYIGICAVYVEKFDAFNNKLNDIIYLLKQNGIRLLSDNKVSLDTSIKASINTTFFSSTNCLFMVSDNDYCCGIVLMIPENELFNDNYSDKKINEIDNWAFKLMKKICHAINCDYIFCDNEADILDFKYNCHDKSFNTNFSIFINNKNKTFILNDWNIDGLTKRTDY